VLDNLLRVLFSHRRKNIRNALICEKKISKELIDTLPYGDIKVDQLSPDMFVDMANRMVEYDEKQN
jgi:16S rRNA A1518/A1519 N6-dimethyltransferase RsmA/KsgA/DIM1 with predicted DNA glycosylase/AP lyase activity